MSDLFSRLAARALGEIPVVDPRLGPGFAAPPSLPDEPAEDEPDGDDSARSDSNA